MFIGTNIPVVGMAAFVGNAGYSEFIDDYVVERRHALKEVMVTLLPNETFNSFLNTKGKQGGQIKFPRVMKGEMYNDWKNYLKTHE